MLEGEICLLPPVPTLCCVVASCGAPALGPASVYTIFITKWRVCSLLSRSASLEVKAEPKATNKLTNQLLLVEKDFLLGQLVGELVGSGDPEFGQSCVVIPVSPHRGTCVIVFN